MRLPIVVTRRVALAALAIVLVGVILASDTVHGLLLDGLAEAERLAGSHPTWAMALVVIFSAFAAILAFVSSWVFLPFAVFTWGPVGALLLLWTGWLLGGALSYAIGRFLGRPAVRWLITPSALARYEARISQRTPFGVILLVQFALPSEIPGYVLGVVRYPFLRYVAALAIVELAWGVASVFLGVGLVERRALPIVAAVAAFVLVTAWAVSRVRRRFATSAAPTTAQPASPPTAVESCTSP